jgi:hypothetical protein
MVDDKVQSSWKRSTDQVKSPLSDAPGDGVKEPEKTAAQQLTAGSDLPQSTTQNSRSVPAK